MATKNQHYVPQVYIKAWETTVSTIREPQKLFTGVYHYRKNNLQVGNGRNKETILANKHTYTIGFDYSFLILKCPDVKKDFVGGIQNILKKRNAIAKYQTITLTSEDAIANYLPFLDNWYFVDTLNNPVRKRPIINLIKDIKSYCLEDRFSSYMENNWESLVNNFLSPLPKIDGIEELSFRYSKIETVSSMLNMLALMMCRNPLFDLFGIFKWLEDDILQPIFSVSDDENKSNEAINELIRGLWLNEIYKGLFEIEGGFVDSLISTTMAKLGVMILRIGSKGEGSFITSDNPIVHHSLVVESSNRNGIYFPLTPDYLLFLGVRSGGSINDVIFRTVGNEDIRRLNQIILNSSNESIISINRYLGFIL